MRTRDIRTSIYDDGCKATSIIARARIIKIKDNQDE